jgi:hypothetical protein
MVRHERRAGRNTVRVILNWGPVAFLGTFVCAVPMVVGVWFAFHPSERLLGLMRPLTLAATFIGVSNTMLALVNTLVWISRREGAVPTNIVATQLAESLLVPFISFGCLGAAWLAVAAGMRKQI